MLNLRTFTCMYLFKRMIKIRALKSSRAASKGLRDGREKGITARAGKGTPSAERDQRGALDSRQSPEPSSQRNDSPLFSFSFSFEIE